MTGHAKPCGKFFNPRRVIPLPSQSRGRAVRIHRESLKNRACFDFAWFPLSGSLPLHMIPRIILAATFSIARAGCVQFTPQPLDPALSAAKLGARRLSGRTWTLRALVEEAVQNHPDVALAKAQYDTARAAVLTAGERPNPTVALSHNLKDREEWIGWSAG